jgi:outer membrane protein TolC
VLSVEELVAQVLARNPTLAQMAAAWEAAQARYPQVSSLEDPMIAGTVGPETFRPDDSGLELAYRLEVSQRIPFPGKLRLKGESARAEASAAGNDLCDTRLQLAEAARDAFYEYYLAERSLEESARAIELLRKARADAAARYETGAGKVDAQDYLQADVEIGREQERRLSYLEARQITVARLNTLLDLPPDSPLPPPPRQLSARDTLPDVQALRAAALARRPDLQAVADRILAEEAALALAHKEQFPDFEPFVMYDRFMGNTADNRDLATMVGVRMNLPVYQERRRGAVAEAQARLAQRRAELARQTAQALLQVEEAYTKVRRGAEALRLYRDKILPVSELNAKSARSAYMTGKVPAVSRIEAERNLVALRQRYHELIAGYYRGLAALERAVGGPLPAPASR